MKKSKKPIIFEWNNDTYKIYKYASGASIKFVQNQLGHSKAELTLDVYSMNSADMP